MSLIKVFPVTEIPEDARKVVNVGDHQVLLIHSGGKFIAVSNQCPHLKLPLKNGRITDDHAIVCPFHHSAFDLENGDVKEWSPWPPVMGKALGSLVREKALPVFSTKVIDGWLWVEDKPL